MPKFDYFEIHRSKYSGYDVKGVKVNGHPRHSVMYGQDLIQYLENFETLKEAQDAYPDATMCNEWIGARNTFDHLPDDGDY